VLLPALTVFVLLYAALLAGWALVVAVMRRRPGPGLLGGLVLLELTLVAQAVLDGIGLAAGHRVAEPATHLGYLVTSVVLLPLLLGLTRPPRRAGSRPVAAGLTAAVIVVACAAVVVVDARLVATGPDATGQPVPAAGLGCRSQPPPPPPVAGRPVTACISCAAMSCSGELSLLVRMTPTQSVPE
jgi:hypothetical protein